MFPVCDEETEGDRQRVLERKKVGKREREREAEKERDNENDNKAI